MRCVIHDYAGHPFQVLLSRQLATRGHEVYHLYFADNPGPKGNMQSESDGRACPRFVGIKLGGPIADVAGTGGQTGLARRASDISYGRKVAQVLRCLRPDVVLSGNTPTDAQRIILRLCKAEGIRFVYWLQDIYGVAVSQLLSNRLGAPGRLIGWYYQQLDRRQFRSSDAIVVISQDFREMLAAWAGSDSKIFVIENWAAIGDIAVGKKDNAWSRQHGLHENFVFAYSGTLGRKHNLALLLKLARRCAPGELLLVAAQGAGMPGLSAAKSAHQIDALKLLPLQPADHLSDLLATADVLVATLEPDAGKFAVPSKVLSYLCAGRPVLLAAPRENLASRIVQRANAGIVVDTRDESGFLAAADLLRGSKNMRAEFGANGRAYAEKTFDIAAITQKFERVLVASESPTSRTPRSPSAVLRLRRARAGSLALGWGAPP